MKIYVVTIDEVGKVPVAAFYISETAEDYIEEKLSEHLERNQIYYNIGEATAEFFIYEVELQ